MATLDKIKSLTVKWSISKAQDTYGYNICTVVNDDNGERFKCLGGGYDMLGTSLANFIEKEYQAELLKNANKAYTIYNKKAGMWVASDHNKYFYGMSYNSDKNIINLDGGCGINSIERIIKEVLGLTLERKYSYDRKGRVKDTIGFYLYPTEDK